MKLYQSALGILGIGMMMAPLTTWAQLTIDQIPTTTPQSNACIQNLIHRQAYYVGQNRYYYATFRDNISINNIWRVCASDSTSSLCPDAQDSRVYVYNPYNALTIGAFGYNSHVKPAGVDTVVTWSQYSTGGATVAVGTAPNRQTLAAQIIHNIRATPAVQGSSNPFTYSYTLPTPGTVMPGILSTVTYNTLVAAPGENQRDTGLLCNDIFVAKCGDGVRDNAAGYTAGGTTNGKDGMNTERGFVEWRVPDATVINEECDLTDIPEPQKTQGYTCNAQCRLVPPPATCQLLTGSANTITAGQSVNFTCTPTAGNYTSLQISANPTAGVIPPALALNQSNGSMQFNTPGNYTVSCSVNGQPAPAVCTQTINVTNPVLNIQKDVDQTTVVGTGLLRYTIRFSNLGQGTAFQTFVSDSLPAGVVIETTPVIQGFRAGANNTALQASLQYRPAGSTQATATGFRFGAFDFPGGATGQIIFTGRIVDASYARYVNTGSIVASGVGPIDDPAVTVRTGTLDLYIVKTGDKQQLQPSDTFVDYTITFGNAGTITSESITELIDTLPNGMQASQILSSQMLVPAGGTLNATLSIPNANNPTDVRILVSRNGQPLRLAPGEQGRIVLRANIANTNLSQYRNIIVIPVQSGELNTGNNTDDDLITRLGPDLRLVKDVQPAGQVRQGDTITYVLNYFNDGGATVNNVEIIDTLPAGVEYVRFLDYTPTNLVISPDANNTSASRTLTFRLNGALAPGQAGTLRFEARIASVTSGQTQIVNTGTVTYPGWNDPNSVNVDPTPANNTDNAISPLTQPQEDVRLIKRLYDPTNGQEVTNPASRPFRIGEQVRFVVEYENRSTTEITDAIIRDIWPGPQLRFDSSDPAMNLIPCTGQTQVTNGPSGCRSLGTLAPGASGRIIMTGTVMSN